MARSFLIRSILLSWVLFNSIASTLKTALILTHSANSIKFHQLLPVLFAYRIIDIKLISSNNVV